MNKEDVKYYLDDFESELKMVQRLSFNRSEKE